MRGRKSTATMAATALLATSVWTLGCHRGAADGDPAPATMRSPAETTTSATAGSPMSDVVVLSPDARELAARFAEPAKKARLLLILSPT